MTGSVRIARKWTRFSNWLTCKECFLPSAASKKLSVTTVRTSPPLTASEASAQSLCHCPDMKRIIIRT